MGMLMLVCAVLASLALGVLVAYGICQAMFQVFRTHAQTAARSRVAAGLMLVVPGVPWGAPFRTAAVSDPAGGGFGASTMPLVEGVVEGVLTASSGTELVVGSVDAVGEVLFGLPLTLLNGCGMGCGPVTAEPGVGCGTGV
jgi:hypothetical protein